MISAKKIKITIIFCFLFTCCAWPQHVNKQYKKTTAQLKNKIESYCYINFDSVFTLCKNLIEVARAEDDILQQLYAISNICWNAEWANKPEVIKYYLKAGEELLLSNRRILESEDSTGLYRSMIMNAIGSHFHNLGSYDIAIDKLSEIVNYGGQPLTQDSSLLRSTCYFIGHSLFSLGRLDQAIQYFDLGSRYIMKNEVDYDYLWAMYYMYNSQYLFSINENERAKELILKSINILKNDPRKEFIRNSLKSNYQLMKDYYMTKKNHDSATFFMNRAIHLFKKNDLDYIIGFQGYGDIYYENNMFDSALYYYEKSLKLADVNRGNSHYRSYALAGMANVEREKKDFTRSLELYNKSLLPLISKQGKLISQIKLENIPGIVLPVETMRILADKASLYYSWGLHDSVPPYLDSSILLLENALFLNDMSRRELVNFETKESRAESRSKITSLGVKASFNACKITGNNRYLEKVFAFMEESKGNIIMDKFDETRARRHAGLPDAISDTLLILKKQLTALSDSILKVEYDSEKADRLKRKYNDKFLAYNNQIALIEKNFPKYYRLKYAPKNVNLEEIRSILPPQALMIQFSLDENNIYIEGITRKKVIVAVADKNEKFNQKFQLLLQQLADPDIAERSQDTRTFNEFVNAASFLYQKILSPVLEKVSPSINELIIIPEGELCYLPFEILITKKFTGNGIDYQSLPYLIRKYRISYDYSASLWQENNRREQAGRNTYVGFAPGKDVKSGQLFASNYEVAACSKIWNGKCLTGGEATETSFKNTAFAGSIIQLATHTLLDDREPQKSCFAFAGGKDSIDDGLLYTYELYNMNIPAKLAILSGCETGIGHIRKGEGIISLARAFKYAGCHNILMSLWKVNDLTTSEIMVLFNSNLKKGMPKDIALQKAKLSYLKKNENLHPAFWSSFVLIGSNTPVSHFYRIYYYIIASLLLLTILTYIRRHTAKKKVS
jgi:CHAT domain-containing protein